MTRVGELVPKRQQLVSLPDGRSNGESRLLREHPRLPATRFDVSVRPIIYIGQQYC